ncbi:MAG: PilZ domain-containing protein [Pikeienuella sp.]
MKGAGICWTAVKLVIVAGIAAMMSAGQSNADTCSLLPWVRAIDMTSDTVARQSTTSALRRLEIEIETFRERHAAANTGTELAAPLQRFITSRSALVMAFQAEGAAATRRLARRSDMVALTRAARTFITTLDCPLLTGPLTERTTPPEQAETMRPTATTHQPQQVLRPLSNTVVALTASVSWGAISVVGAIFGGFVFLVTRSRRRISRRFICFLPAELIYNGKHTEAHLIEISRSGAKVTSTEPITAQEKLTIVLSTERLNATAIWANATCIGVKFDHRIPRQNLSDLLKNAGGAKGRGKGG